MKITCPNCKKKYTINEAKIPAGAKAVKCKACGHRMPLKRKAPADRPVIKKAAIAGASGKSPVIRRSCIYCGHNHALSRDEIAPGTASVKCKSCGRPLPLKLEEAAGSALVHSLKKEASKKDTVEKPLKAPSQLPRTPEVITLTCKNCQKRYKIQSNKIPATAKSLKCRSCGHRINLPVPQEVAKQPMPAPLGLWPAAFRPERNMRLTAMTVGLLLLVLAGVYAGVTMFKGRGMELFTFGTPKQPSASTALLRQEPFLALNLNLPLILNNIDRPVARDKKALKFRSTISLVKSLRLKNLAVFLYAGSRKQILPVFLARGNNARHLEKLVTRPDAFADYFERQSAGTYRFKPKALVQTEGYGFFEEPYQLILVDKGAVFAPASMAEALASDQSWLQKTAVAEFAESIADPQDLVRVAIRISADMPEGWETEIQKNPVWAYIPQMAMIEGMSRTILARLPESLEPVETLALGFRLTGKNGRTLQYAQQFQPDVDGNAVYQKLNAEEHQDGEVDGIIRELLALFQNPRYRHDLKFADNRLDLEFSWRRNDDKIFLSALSQATIGQRLSKSLALTPTPGSVAAEYTDDPQLFTTVDSQALKPRIPGLVKQSLSPGIYIHSGKKPQMILNLNPVNIPNAPLAKLSYEVLSIKSQDGRDILRSENYQLKHTINFGGVLPSRVILNVQNGTPTASLGKARIQFWLALPDTLQVFSFKKGEDQDHRKDAGGIHVNLDRLEKDVAGVTASGGKSVHLIAYDKTGNALAPRDSISSGSSVATRFQGEIDRIKVVVAVNVADFPFEIEVELNGGRIRNASLDGKSEKEN